jgi:hypothetical protein
MATVELSVEQLREAIIQLPEPQRRQLLKDLKRIPAAREARAASRQLRGTFRMNPRQRKRLSELLAKGNDGTLTAAESREVDTLVDQFESKTLEFARQLAKTKRSS